MGLGYGSEFHLLRMLGRHRNSLNDKILTELNYRDKNIEWIDFKFDAKQFIPDQEYVGIEFLKSLKDYSTIESKWKSFWPNKNKSQNWDAIGKIGDEWLLVEAKAHAEEINSNTHASVKSKKKIQDKFKELHLKLSINTSNDWTQNYYQKANRILFLDFLKQNGINAKLVFIYFLNGYKQNGIQQGIEKVKEWQRVIDEQDNYLGISGNKMLKSMIINVFVDIDK